MSSAGFDPSLVDLQHHTNDHSTTKAISENSYFSKGFKTWPEIDSSHVHLQHLANDHTSTRAISASTCFSIIPNSFLLSSN